MQSDKTDSVATSWIKQALCIHQWAPPQRNPAFGSGFFSSTCNKCGRVRNGHAIIRRMPAPFLNGLAPLERRHLAR